MLYCIEYSLSTKEWWIALIHPPLHYVAERQRQILAEIET